MWQKGQDVTSEAMQLPPGAVSPSLSLSQPIHQAVRKPSSHMERPGVAVLADGPR